METKKPIEITGVTNPSSEDLHFKYDSAEYVLPAGQRKEFTAPVAFLAAKKLADKNAKTSSMDERKVLIKAYLENSDPEVIAKELGINLDKIRAEVLTKEKEKSRVINLEAMVMEQNRKIEELMKRNTTEEVKEVKIDKRTKEYKNSVKEEIKPTN